MGYQRFSSGGGKGRGHRGGANHRFASGLKQWFLAIGSAVGNNGRSRRSRSGWSLILGEFYMNPTTQFVTTLVSAVVLTGFVFSGVLLYRYTDAQDLLGRGRRYLEQGKVAWAMNTFQNLVDQHPRHFEGYLLLGQSYLELGDRVNAERAFRQASKLRPNGKEDARAFLAMSKLALSQNNFETAETALLKAYPLSQNNRPTRAMVRQAMVDLYMRWARNHLMSDNQARLALTHPSAKTSDQTPGAEAMTMNIQKPELLAKAIDWVHEALRYVDDYNQEEMVLDTLNRLAEPYAAYLEAHHQKEKSVKVLKAVVERRANAPMMLKIAAYYAEQKQYEVALDWYRRCFDLAPHVASQPLSHLLLKKANGLLAEGKTVEAEAMFAEAKRVSQMANIPLDELYPVEVSQLKFDLNPSNARTLWPKLSVWFENKSEHQLSMLRAKVTLLKGNTIISEQELPLAQANRPLAPQGKHGSGRALVFQPKAPLIWHQWDANQDNVPLGSLLVRLALSYGSATDWQTKVLKEIPLQPHFTKKPAEDIHENIDTADTNALSPPEAEPR